MQIQNPEASEIIRTEAGLTLSEGFPQNLMQNVVPVIDMTPSFHKSGFLYSSIRTTSGSGTIFTTDAQKKTYITAITFSYSKNATCDVATGSLALRANIDGVNTNIALLPVIALTAQQEAVSIQFPNPILLTKNTTFFFEGNTYTAGTLVRTALITGYTE